LLPEFPDDQNGCLRDGEAAEVREGVLEEEKGESSSSSP